MLRTSSSPGDARRAERPVADDERPDRLRAALLGHDLDVGAHRDERVEQPGTGRVQADARELELGARHERGGDDQKRRRGEIAREHDRRAVQRLRSVELDPELGAAEPYAEVAQHAFGVIARAHRLLDPGRSAGLQAGEEDRGLHLRARDRERVRDADERTALDAERCPAVARLARDRRAHATERLDHPPHRPAQERFVTGETARERTPREHARHAAGWSCRSSRSRARRRVRGGRRSRCPRCGAARPRPRS